jgi:hypothetical protein
LIGLGSLTAALLLSAEPPATSPTSVPASGPASLSGAEPRSETQAATSVDEAISLYHQTRFAQSISILDTLFQEASSVELRKRIKLYLGMNFLALGRDHRAEAEFRELLDLDPDFAPPVFVSPLVREFFAQVKKSHKIIPFLAHSGLSLIDAEVGAEIVVRIQRMRPGYEAKLLYRRHGDKSFASVDLSAPLGDLYSAKLPPAFLIKEEGYMLEYFFQVSEGKDDVLASLRSAENPFIVSVAVPIRFRTQAPVYKKWWFWTGLGGGVAAAVVATIVGVALSAPSKVGEADVAFGY